MERIQRTLFSSIAANVPLHGQSPAAAMKAAADWRPPGHSGHRPAPMGRIKIQVRLAAAGIVRLGRPEGNKCLDHGCERGQDADPPVHAARARDVLQLNGARVLLGALRTCRCAGVAHPYI